MIEAYKLEDASQKSARTENLIETNIANVELFYQDTRARLIFEKSISDSIRRAEVLKRGNEIEEKKIRTFEARIKQKDAAIHRNKYRKAEQSDKQGKLQQMQYRWYVAIGLASRLALVREFLEEKHKMRQAYMAFNHSAVVIQKVYKKYKEHLRMQLVQKSYAIIRRYQIKLDQTGCSCSMSKREEKRLGIWQLILFGSFSGMCMT